MRMLGAPLSPLVAVLMCGVMFDCSADAGVQPNSWPPKMKNFDIWGDAESAKSSTSTSNGDSRTASSSSSSRTVESNDDDDDGSDMSSAEIIRSAYGRTNETGWQRAGKGK